MAVEDPHTADPGLEPLKSPKSQNEEFKKVSFTSLFQYADKWDILLMFVGTVGAIGLGATMPLLSLLFGSLTDSFGNNSANSEDLVDNVTSVALQFVYLALGAAVAGYLEMSFWMLTGERQSARIRSLFLKAVLRQDISFFDMEASTGELVERMSGDIVLVQEAMGEKVGTCIRLMSTFVGGFCIAFVRGWLLTLVMIAALPLLIICGGLMAAVISQAATKGQEAYGDAGALVEQCVGGIRTVMSFTGEKRALEQYDKSLADADRMGRRQGLYSGLGMGVTLFVMFSCYALALWFGSFFIRNNIGSYTGGKVLTVLLAVVIGGMSLGQATPSLTAFAAGQAAAFKIFQVISRNPDIDVYNVEGEIPDAVVGDLEFRNVHFAYPSRLDVMVFSGFSLVIPAGKTVALVGESGSGKSTIVSLLERFYEPTKGSVLLDGRNLRSLQLRWLRDQMGLVSQEPVLFGTSIRANIAFGKDGATEEEIMNAARLANVHRFVSSLPHGYDTDVGEKGTQLSGGQKQRIAIARAILRNPRILLLDEATSALDAESERVVQVALERAMVDRTTVVVAHRLSTIRNANLIAVLQRGQLVETGTHRELVQKEGGAYAQLIRLQQTDEQDGGSSSQGSSSEQKSAAVSPTLHSSEELDTLLEDTKRKEGEDELEATQNPVRFVSKVQRLLPWLSRKPQEAADEEKGSKQKEKDVSVLRLARLNKPEWLYGVIGSVSAAAQGATFPLFSVLLSHIIVTLYEKDKKKLQKDADFWSLMFVVLAGYCFLTILLQIWMFAIMGSALIRRVRRLCFQQVMAQEVAWFDDSANSSGAIGARLSSDAAHVRAMVGDNLALLVQNLTTISVGLGIAFAANWTLSLVVLSVVPLLLFSGMMQMKAIRGFSENAKVMYEGASKVANDAVGSIRTVAAFGAEHKMARLYDEKCQLPLQAGIRKAQVSGLGLGFSNLCMFSVYALAFWYGGQLVKENKTSFRDVFQVFFAIVMSAMGVAQSTSLAKDATEVQIAVNSIFKILDRKSEIDPSAPGETLDDVQGQIELRNVKFRYPSRPDVVVFDDLCLVAKAGQTLALVGESGSGKSTVVSLIERFYDPLEGSVLIDGIDIRSLQLKWLRQQIGLVSQEPVLFNTSIRDNIAYGQENVTEAEIVAAATDANAHKFISALPEGYNTLVGERGVQLSGGQKQRVAIARAIVKNPKILLLDEATSALDAESEHVVQEALDRVMVGRTTVVIAHRLTTVRNAQVIAVVQEGVIVEQGTHEHLLSVDGAYASLVKLHSHSK